MCCVVLVSPIYVLQAPLLPSFSLSHLQFSTLACNLRTQKRERHLSFLSLKIPKIIRTTRRGSDGDSDSDATHKIQALQDSESKTQKKSAIFIIIYPFFCFLLYHLSLERETERERQRERSSSIILHCPLCSGRGFLLDRNWVLLQFCSF